ncbi:10522_t:CDS:1, partial [Cetraspora pellucida]
LPVIFEYNKEKKIYVVLILFANNVPAVRKICDHVNYVVKCYYCPKCSKYDSDTKRNYYNSFENMELFIPIDIS